MHWEHALTAAVLTAELAHHRLLRLLCAMRDMFAAHVQYR